jgi:MFS family permease
MTASASVTNQLSTRVAAIAVTLMFIANGLVIGGYGGSLPSLRDKLGIDATHIAIMLFCAGAAAILAMQIGGRLADALGAREITLAAFPLLIVGMITIGLAPNFAIAIVGVALLGLGNGAMDVSMNAIGVQVEAARQRPIMSFFHAFWSIGTFIGAGVVLLLATVLGLHGAAIVTPVSIFIAAATAVALGVLFKITPEAAVVHHTVDGVKTPIPKVTWTLAAMALAFGLSEGTATDWSSLHVTDVAGVDPTTGALGLITVSAFMVVIRLLGDRLVTRYGRRAVVRFGALFAALGYLMVTLVSSLPLLIAGWALVGFGVGMIAPPVYAVAGHIGGGRVLAVVVTFGYAAFLIGPAFMGFLVNQLGIHHAMAAPALLCAGIIALASTMPREDVGLSKP